MRWYYKIFIIGVIVTVITIALIRLNIYLLYITISSSLVTIFLGALSFYKKEEKEQMTELFIKLLNEFQKEKEKHQIEEQIHKGEIKRIEQEVESEKTKRQRLSRVFDNIGLTLNKENISKEELINNISNPLKAIVFQKYWEDPDKKRFILRDKIYPIIHAYHIKGGLCIIPPAYVPQDKSNDELIEWFKKQFKENVPSDYEYNIDFITTVNLTDIKSFEHLGKRFERGHFNWLRNIPTEDIAPTDMIMNYLAMKKDISTRDIIEIPNLLFLVDDNLITLLDNEILKNEGEKIINDIKKYLRIQELKTTDLASIDSKELTLILTDNGVKNPLIVSDMLIRNAKIWKLILDRELTQE